MRNLWNKCAIALAIASFALAFPQNASAQSQKTFAGEGYNITFPAVWDTATSRSILAKLGGIGGMATLGSEKTTTLPNIDSIADSLSVFLGGKITKDSAGVKTIATYQVHWQKFTYDSLPALSKIITEASGFPVNLKNGSFRVYYLNSNGVGFTIAGMAIITGGVPPYTDIENAIATLKLGSQAGIISLERTGGRDLWVRDGKLGGSWLKANKVFAVECFDSRGSLIGSATHAAEGTWNLPASRNEMFVRLRTAVGTGLHFIVRQ